VFGRPPLQLCSGTSMARARACLQGARFRSLAPPLPSPGRPPARSATPRRRSAALSWRTRPASPASGPRWRSARSGGTRSWRG
jgi:hypothetical protein